jgi:hypothetical protein
MTNEELDQIQAGAMRYHTMSSDVVLKLIAEIKWLRIVLEARKNPTTFTPVVLQKDNATDWE